MKKVIKLCICVCFISTSVFAGTYPDPEPEVPSEKSVIHVYRPSRIVGFGWNFKLMADGRKVGKVKNGDHLILELDAGQVQLQMNKNNIDLNLEPGKHYYLRASLVRNIFLGKPEIVEVTETQAKGELEDF